MLHFRHTFIDFKKRPFINDIEKVFTFRYFSADAFKTISCGGMFTETILGSDTFSLKKLSGSSIEREYDFMSTLSK